MRREMDETYLSKSWLKEQDRKESRVEYNGVKWNWPVNKLLNERPMKIVRNDISKRLQAS